MGSFTMNAIDYMKKQVVKNERNLVIISQRSGVTKEEMDNIRSKIGYYKEAVVALESMEVM